MRDVERRLERLADAAGDLTPAFRDVGEALLNSTRDRFERQAGPDGRRWAPLSPEYARRKPRNKGRILTLYGELHGTLRYVATADSVAVGTNEVYGPTHQFGDENRNIPPFAGVSIRRFPIPSPHVDTRPEHRHPCIRVSGRSVRTLGGEKSGRFRS